MVNCVGDENLDPENSTLYELSTPSMKLCVPLCAPTLSSGNTVWSRVRRGRRNRRGFKKRRGQRNLSLPGRSHGQRQANISLQSHKLHNLCNLWLPLPERLPDKRNPKQARPILAQCNAATRLPSIVPTLPSTCAQVPCPPHPARFDPAASRRSGRYPPNPLSAVCGQPHETTEFCVQFWPSPGPFLGTLCPTVVSVRQSPVCRTGRRAPHAPLVL